MKKLALILLTICCACNLDEQDTQDPVFCTDELRPGLEITVLDSLDNTVITSGIMVIAKDGDYTETLVNFEGTTTFVGAFERTGTYSISIGSEVYENFSSTESIMVDKDICHVITESREIILQSN
ncbi:hypothetical protein [Aquimarina litoralis]|uniref:hypothetical protein n=1 Tax=Aquimarina litoralis TaxID=584605 RepID=UPI001C58F75D|nr:hypothetical protein [Aquimarina litoralis]MBW1293971.1 hypothetical protein [Aquimarina litoralis]